MRLGLFVWLSVLLSFQYRRSSCSCVWEFFFLLPLVYTLGFWSRRGPPGQLFCFFFGAMLLLATKPRNKNARHWGGSVRTYVYVYWHVAVGERCHYRFFLGMIYIYIYQVPGI